MLREHYPNDKRFEEALGCVAELSPELKKIDSYWLFQGLYITRDIPALIIKSGFQTKQMEQGYLAEFLKSSSYCWSGIDRQLIQK